MSFSKQRPKALCALFGALALLCSAAVADDAAHEARIKALKENRKGVSRRIVGGVVADAVKWPWAVAIGYRKSDGELHQFCGGTLIDRQWVLTAAHCKVTTGDEVVAGRPALSSSDGQILEIAEVINHEGYNELNNDADIALVRLAQGTDLTPSALIDAQDSPLPAKEAFTVTGWGLLEEGGESSDELLEVTVGVLSQPTCEEMYAGAGVLITDNMLCAGTLGKDACQGDSGGGGFVWDASANTYRQAGIVSFGIGCANPNFVGVYTRVSQFLDWIKENADVAH